MKIFFKLFIALSTLVLTACSSDTNISDTPSADLVFHHGKIYTVDEQQPWAEAVAVSNGEIVFVGSNEAVKKWVGENTKQQDLQGKMLLPGFIDSHAHPVMGGAYVRSLSLDSFADPKHWLEQIKDYAEQNPDDKVVFGYGFLASAFGPQGPTSALIDTVVSDRPVFMLDEGFHGAWANTKAIQLLNINKETPDPVPGFSYYKRDELGNPTGYLLEGTANLAAEALGIITAESVALGAGDVIDIMNSYGITAVFDAGALDVDSLQMKVLENVSAQGKMNVRLVGSHMVTSVAAMDNAIAKAVNKRATTKTDMYHIRMLKIMNDGTIEGKTAGMFEDYQGEPGNKGETVFSQQQMNDMVAQASAQDIDIHIHALGERAISEALNAIELARKEQADSKSRYTICHIQVMTDRNVQRFADLNVIAQSTPLWTSYDEFGKQFVSEDQFNRYFRFNSLKEAGVKMSFGSDYPASGAGTLGISPIFSMEIGHTRQNPGEPDAPIQPNIEERLDIASLIRGYTLDGAYQLHMEDEIGSINVGKKADFVVLDKNLFEEAPYEIHKVKVLQTILAGKTVYQAP
ncbi:amidohydrolase [Colwelliaceae bacterium 6471]